MESAADVSAEDRYVAKIREARASTALLARRRLKNIKGGQHQQTLDTLIRAAEAHIKGTTSPAINREEVRNLLLAIEPVPPDLRDALVMVRWLAVQAGVLS